MFSGPFTESIIKRAQTNKLMTAALHNIRTYTTDRHHICDDAPYGGGGGMVMKPEPIFRAVETVLAHPRGWALPEGDADPELPPWDPAQPPARYHVQDDRRQNHAPDVPVILLSPQGRQLNQSIVAELVQYPRIALICGRYEGVDERVRTQLVTDELSIGDYVLSGGELAAMVVVDAVTRVIPGALGFALGAYQDSHSPGLGGLLEGPQYTRPPVFRDETVPDILLSGHHGRVATWRHQQALLRTLRRRPDLLQQLALSDEDRAFLRDHGWQADDLSREEADKSE